MLWITIKHIHSNLKTSLLTMKFLPLIKSPSLSNPLLMSFIHQRYGKKG